MCLDGLDGIKKVAIEESMGIYTCFPSNHQYETKQEIKAYQKGLENQKHWYTLVRFSIQPWGATESVVG